MNTLVVLMRDGIRESRKHYSSNEKHVNSLNRLVVRVEDTTKTLLERHEIMVKSQEGMVERLEKLCQLLAETLAK
jgi:hypothetical protein